MLVAWLLFPLVLAVLALGVGLLIERISGTNLPGPLLFPLGLAGIIVVAQFLTLADGTAELSTPVVTALAIAGLVLTRPWSGRRIDTWALVSAGGVFLVFAAPVLFSGEATFAGYVKQEDISTFLSLTDWVMDHGRDATAPATTGFVPSTYDFLRNLSAGYPVGSFLPFGVSKELLGEEGAWVFQPYLAVLAATLALGLYGLIGELVPSRPLRALTVFIAAQPALLFAFSLNGGIKEMTAVTLLPLISALVARMVGRAFEYRELAPACIVIAALLCVLSIGGAVWIAPAILIALVVMTADIGNREAIRRTVAFSALAVALSIPTLIQAPDFLASANTLTSESTHGNLAGPLKLAQVAGIWPTGDFRVTPSNSGAAYVLIILALEAAVGGFIWAWRRRAWAVVIYVSGTAAACLAVLAWGSLWTDAKALAITSPAILLASTVAVAALADRLRALAVLVVIALAGGVLWSNALAYHDVDLAPRDRLAELETIGERIDHKGPSLTNEEEFYGVRHFLLDAEPETPKLAASRGYLIRGGPAAEGAGLTDVDLVNTTGLFAYRTLVLRRSPLDSRPPGAYTRTWRGRYYEVWERSDDRVAATRQHLAVGAQGPVAVPNCRDVLSVARSAKSDLIAAAPGQAPAVLDSVIQPTGSETINGVLPTPEAGMYETWIGGSFRSRLKLYVDGKLVGDERHRLNSLSNEFEPLGEVRLTGGVHEVRAKYLGPDLHPGSDGNEVIPEHWPPGPFSVGPLALSGNAKDTPISLVEPAKARTLCGKSLDWIEVVAR